MWRRVASQSPVSAPADAASQQQTELYLNGWRALGALLHSGHSLSGHERNCCFLNLGTGRFANGSAALALDYADDARGLVMTDWDRDGDLDLWTTNRSSPRVRFLQNTMPRGNHFLAIKLRGLRCNRDAIGARVEVYTGQRKRIQTLAAGEGFLSQSSKWLHFGLGPARQVDRLVIRWPDGSRQEFTELAVNRRWEIVQDQPTPIPWQVSRRPLPSKAPAAAVPSPSVKRIILAHRLPLPAIPYQNLAGQPQADVPRGSAATLVNLWATSCPPCLAELQTWSENRAQLDERGIRVLALNVDVLQEAASLQEVRDFFDRMGWSLDCGLAGAETLDMLEAAHHILLNYQEPLPVPSTFLLDAQGQLVALYKGAVPLPQLLADVEALSATLPDRDRAVPLRGQWLTQPAPADLLAIPKQLLTIGRPQAALDYLLQHVASEERSAQVRQLDLAPAEVARSFLQTARLLMRDDQFEPAVQAYRMAAQSRPDDWEARAELAELLIRLRQSTAALEQSQAMLRLRPGHPIALNNIAWILATAQEAALRDPQKAVKIAEQVCQHTQWQEPTALETLAISYAAAGRFEEAIRTTRQAMKLAQSLGLNALIDRLNERLKLFQAGQAYVP